MIIEAPASKRSMKTEKISCDLVVVGGGLAGVCGAITAAREGVRVVLVQDRPVVGGNASSEVRLWILGATSHMGNNNRWAREGGVIDEILVENTFRNPEGNPLMLDALLLEKLSEEANIRLLLNTAAFQAEKRDADTIERIHAFCSQNSTFYELTAPLFCDASGDGVIGFLAGAAFRIGAEARAEFDEGFAPEISNGELLGHTIYFYSKDAGRPVKYVPPSFALDDITKIPRFRQFNTKDIGCRLWWIEWGGMLDTIHETEAIKWELWRVVYGVWNHIKNSGEFPDAQNLTLEWIGTIPGKRESRRFEGDYILNQRDLVEQREHPDAVAFGGWAIDLHPADGVFSEGPGCVQWHTKGVYQIPYRCLYSRNISNLFLAGRLISASHVAFGSTRVMATCAHSAQAVGVAAALCIENQAKPKEIGDQRISELQTRLLRVGQYIPGTPLQDPADLVAKATVTASSEFVLSGFAPNGESAALEFSAGMMLPVTPGSAPKVTFRADVKATTVLEATLAISSRPGNHTPDRVLETIRLELSPGADQSIALDFHQNIEHPCYAFYCLKHSPDVSVHLSDERVTGVLAVSQRFNRAVAKSAQQVPPDGIGIDTLEFWLPERRPGGKNFAMQVEPGLRAFSAGNVSNGIARPTNQPNAWVAALNDAVPELRIAWDTIQSISRVELSFDTDFDHPMESVLMGHAETTMPFCVQNFELLGHDGEVLYTCAQNHQTRYTVIFPQNVETSELTLRLSKLDSKNERALLGIRCYSSTSPNHEQES